MKSNNLYIYGRKPVFEELNHHPENVIRVFLSDRVDNNDDDLLAIRSLSKEQRIPFNTVAPKTFTSYVGDVNDQGVVALLREPQYLDFNEWIANLADVEKGFVLILDHVEDTHNFGAILRTALAAGTLGVVVAKDHQAPLNATVFKTSAGAATRVPVVRVANINQAIERLKEARFWIAAVDMPERKQDIIWEHQLDAKTAFVVGGEGSGVSHRTKELCDFTVSLPIENEVESLNVSVATACAVYEWKRQHY